MFLEALTQAGFIQLVGVYAVLLVDSEWETVLETINKRVCLCSSCSLLLRICRCSSRIFVLGGRDLTTVTIFIVPFKQYCCTGQRKIQMWIPPFQKPSLFSEKLQNPTESVLTSVPHSSWPPWVFFLSAYWLNTWTWSNLLLITVWELARMGDGIFLWSTVASVHILCLLASLWEERGNPIKNTPPELSCEHFHSWKRPEGVIKFLWCPIFFKGWVFFLP
jgi:hypothetical protein